MFSNFNLDRSRYLFFVTCIASLLGCTAGDAYTLYRGSPIMDSARVHVATFDTSDGAAYNMENCQLAAKLFQQQPGVVVNFWCEKGTFKK